MKQFFIRCFYKKKYNVLLKKHTKQFDVETSGKFL